MFTVAKPKFDENSFVFLREKLNYWVDKKTLGTFSKGHQFCVVKSHISETQAQCIEVFEETGEIVNPQFYYDLVDSDGHHIMAYQDDLKRVRIASDRPEDQDEEDEEAMAKTQTSSKRAKSDFSPGRLQSAPIRGGKPTLVNF